MLKQIVTLMESKGYSNRRLALVAVGGFCSMLLASQYAGVIARSTELHLAEWIPAGQMSVSPNRTGVQVTSISDGRVVVTGGARLGTVGATAEIYDPNTWLWTRLPNMACPRAWHTATMLPDGSLLVVGGNVQPESPRRVWALQRSEPHRSTVYCDSASEAEIYHSNTNSWEGVGFTLSTPRWGHIAVPLQNGEVLIAGGQDQTKSLRGAEIYNSMSRQWRPAAAMNQVRHLASAVRLPDGRVLVVGGTTESSSDWSQMSGSSTAEIYDPTSDSWLIVGSMEKMRWLGSATLLNNGRVIVTGLTSPLADASKREGSSEIFDPESTTWSELVSMVGKVDIGMSATLLASGRLLVAGGFWIAEGTPLLLAPAQIYDPWLNSWQSVVQPNSRHAFPGAARLEDGSVLLVGEGGGPERFWESSPTPSPISLPTSMTATPTLIPTDLPLSPTATSTHTVVFTPIPSLTSAPTATRQLVGTWTRVAQPHFARHGGDAVLLSDGRVLFAGGYSRVTSPAAQTLQPPSEIYDPIKDEWTFAGQLNEPRVDLRLVALEGDTIFAIGGVWDRVPRTSVERYDEKSNTWILHGEIRLPAESWLSHLVSPALDISTGHILISGMWPKGTGDCNNALLPETVLFDLRSKLSSTGPRLSQGRSEYLAARLTDGSILVAGGTSEYENSVRFCEKRFERLRTSELLRPGEVTFRTIGGMTTVHTYPDSNLLALSRARAVIVGGSSPSSPMSIELYDSLRESWTPISGMLTSHNSAQVAELTSQRLLVVGGYDSYVAVARSELLDLHSNLWFDAGQMSSPRGRAASVVLSDGRFLVAGGDEHGTAEIYSIAESSTPWRLFAPSLLSRR